MNRPLSTLVVIVPFIPLLYLFLWLIESLQLWHCPPGTFLAGAEHLLLQNSPLAFSALALAMLLGYAAARSPTLFQALGGEATFGDARVRRMTVFFAAIIFFTFGAFSLEMSRASYCLAPSHIWVRPWPWQEMRRFRWQDVGLVGASCTYGKGWSATLRLYMRSGEVIEIPHSQIAESFYSIKRALRGLRVDVDKRDINPDCDVPEKDLLLQLN